MRVRAARVAGLCILLSVIIVIVASTISGCVPSSATGIPSTEDKAAPQRAADPVEDAAEEVATEPMTPGEEPLYTPSYKPNGSEIAAIKTKKGVIKFKFYPKDAPNHVAAFIELAKRGFYDGTKFHRVVPSFVIQGGDPLSKTDDPMVGTGGPGYQLKAEFDPATNKQKHLNGTVAMARSQSPDSAGSQFYITLGPQPMLDGQYTVFGQVVEGLDVVESITVGDVMESVTIENAD